MLIDKIIYNAMQATENPITTTVAKFISTIFDPITIIIITLAISTYLFLKSQKKQAIFLTSIVLITALIVKATKEILQVARPPNPIIAETTFSLPSGHVTMTIVFLGLITYMLTKNKPTKIKTTAAIITALTIIVVTFSRIYLRVHWLSDTLAAFAIGSIILLLATQLYDKTITSAESNKFRFHSQPSPQNPHQPPALS